MRSRIYLHDPQTGTPSDIDLRVEKARAMVDASTWARLFEVLATGCMVNETHFDWSPPTIELRDGLIIAHENFRLL